ncbi:MAG: type II toxin-antitoxin system HicA family toxin [Nanoarchaeota archaeon]|nr:type II toxin-antitoxin system HicA family toxin [Nanoarchaeota archaeon]
MKLPQISGKDLINIFIKLGFIVVRQRGSHAQLERITESEIIKLTVPMHQQLKKGTLSHIIKASKIDEKELEKYF